MDHREFEEAIAPFCRKIIDSDTGHFIKYEVTWKIRRMAIDLRDNKIKLPTKFSEKEIEQRRKYAFKKRTKNIEQGENDNGS